jgi:hypothetical protein
VSEKASADAYTSCVNAATPPTTSSQRTLALIASAASIPNRLLARVETNMISAIDADSWPNTTMK